jgi:hypothetical protein
MGWWGERAVAIVLARFGRKIGAVREGFEPSFGFGLIPCALLCIVSAERLALNGDYRNKGNSERCLDFARHDKKLTGSTNLPSMKLPIWNALVRIREFKRSTSNAEV